MRYLSRVPTGWDAARALEGLYGEAVRENAADEFRDDIEAAFAAAPDNMLLEAWHLRLARDTAGARERRPVRWSVAIPLSLLVALALWWLSGKQFVFVDAPSRTIPFLTLLVTPVIALVALVFFSVTRPQGYRVPVALGAGLVVVTAYALRFSVQDAGYRQIASMHLPLMSWAVVGVCLMGARASAANRFAFLEKSIEVTVVTGVYALAAMAFAGISMQMFRTLGVSLTEPASRLLVVGSTGLMPMIAVASVYDPGLPPADQDFRRGLSRMVTTLPRLMLVLTLLVLAIYIALIPANFMQPFRDRTVLITYNVMMVAVVALLAGATPVNADDLSDRYQTWLRRGIVAVAVLVVLVGGYALAAVVYRTVYDRLTINRLTIIGWNVINIGLLVRLLILQVLGGKARWIESLHATFSAASVAYCGWAACVTLVTAWLF